MVHPIAGIDYGNGQVNLNKDANIRYGVINPNHCASWIWDELQPDYGTPTCPNCGTELADDELDSECRTCGHETDLETCYPETPLRHSSDDGKLFTDSDCTMLWVTDSKYYTEALFCSPCVPGAGDLDSPKVGGIKTYCLGPEYFDEFNPCPYPVYEVATGKRVA